MAPRGRCDWGRRCPSRSVQPRVASRRSVTWSRWCARLAISSAVAMWSCSFPSRAREDRRSRRCWRRCLISRRKRRSSPAGWHRANPSRWLRGRCPSRCRRPGRIFSACSRKPESTGRQPWSRSSEIGQNPNLDPYHSYGGRLRAGRRSRPTRQVMQTGGSSVQPRYCPTAKGLTAKHP